MSNSEIRSFTKENVKGKKGRIIGVGIVISFCSGIITSILSSILYLILSKSDLSNYIVISLTAAVSAPLIFGYCRYVINLVRNEETTIGVIFNYYKYFLPIFLVAICFNLVTGLATAVPALSNGILGTIYSILAALVLIVYSSVQNMIALHPEKKPFEAVKDAFAKFKGYIWRYICLQLSYFWPFIIIAFLYVVAAVVALGTAILTNISELEALIESASTDYDAIFAYFGAFVPFLIVTILFVTAVFVFAFVILPKSLFATAKFFLVVFGEDNKVVNGTPVQQPQVANPEVAPIVGEQTKKFCPNCGTPVNGSFCTNCGNKM